MSDVVDIRQADDQRDVIHRACEKLTEGRLVSFPTETVYAVAASATSPLGIERLAAICPDRPGVLLLKSIEEARDYLPDLPAVARKLAKRCWPGPLIVSFSQEFVGGLYRALPPAARTATTGKSGHVAFRVASHDVLTAIQYLSPAPLVMLPEQDGLRTAKDVAQRFGEHVDLVIDGGPARFGEPATMVEIGRQGWQVSQPGVVSERALQRLASEIYLFVCTGNTCRSPMAEAIFRHSLAQRLGCAEDELEERGHLVVSAGLSAEPGSPAAPDAIELLSAEGIDLSGHESQPLTERLLNHVDHVFAMTRQHRAAILSERPDLEQTVQLLSPDRVDISDPIGGGRAEYEACKLDIERCVTAILHRLFPQASASS